MRASTSISPTRSASASSARSTIDATQFSGIVPALQAGTYDFVAAPTTVTKERADNMLFTEGYLNTDFQFLVKKGGPKVEKLEDLKGKIVSVNKGSAYDSWARDLEAKIGWKVESFGTQTDAVQAVIAGRADANVAGNTVIAWAVKNNPQLELSYLHSTGLVWAAPLRKDFGRAAQGTRERDRVHEARRHHRGDAREVVRHQARARLRRRDGVPRLRRARHGGIRSDRAQAGVQLILLVSRTRCSAECGAPQMRDRTGSGGPGSASHHCMLRRVRDTSDDSPPPRPRAAQILRRDARCCAAST